MSFGVSLLAVRNWQPDTYEGSHSDSVWPGWNRGDLSWPSASKISYFSIALAYVWIARQLPQLLPY